MVVQSIQKKRGEAERAFNNINMEEVRASDLDLGDENTGVRICFRKNKENEF